MAGQQRQPPKSPYLLPGGALAILIADVVDKGVGAAPYLAMSCALLRAFVAERPNRPELVCAAVNERLPEYASAGRSVAAILGILDPTTGVLVYANAGHNPPVLLARSRAMCSSSPTQVCPWA